MKILLISDTHRNHPDLSVYKDLADIVVHAGDLTGRGGRYETEDELFMLGLNKKYFRKIIFIPGNHDFFFEHSWDEAVKMAEENGICVLNDSGVEVDGVNFWGSASTPEFCSWAFNRKRGEEIREYWDLIPDDTDVLITHGPPYGILDRVNNDIQDDKHQGCQDLLKTVVERVKPQIHVFGHIHEGYGYKEANGIHFYNVSYVDENYVPGQSPIVVEV